MTQWPDDPDPPDSLATADKLVPWEDSQKVFFEPKQEERQRRPPPLKKEKKRVPTLNWMRLLDNCLKHPLKGVRLWKFKLTPARLTELEQLIKLGQLTA